MVKWQRTRRYRDTMRDVAQKSMQSLSDDLVAVNFPDAKKPTVVVGEMTAIHCQKIFDWDEIKRMAADMERHYWVVGINNTGHLFYTSVHPVVRRGNQRDANGRFMVGILDLGVEFAFPLDSRHILLIMERTHFADWRKHDNQGIVLSADQVQDYNGLQVMRSHQRVFCTNDDFDLACDVCAAHPEVRDPNRPRVVVETTPIVPAGIGEDGKEQRKNYMFVTALE